MLDLLQLLGTVFFPALAGAVIAARWRPPARLFLAAWGVAFFCAFAAVLALRAAPAHPDLISGVGQLLVPGVAAWLFVRRQRRLA